MQVGTILPDHGFKRGKKVDAGKTKTLYRVKGRPDLLWVENKDKITAHDKKEFTKSFDTKAGYATNTTCRVFELLEAAGIETAYVCQVSPTAFICKRLDMIKLEVVARRSAVGSFTDRNPHLQKEKGEEPHRFHSLVREFFLKTSNGNLSVNGEPLVKNLRGLVKDPDTKKFKMGIVDDPFIPDPYNELGWALVNPKLPKWHEKYDLGQSIDPRFVLRNQTADLLKIDELLRKIFYVLEKAWAVLEMRLIDFKLEFGYDMAGNLVVGDVIDNDSWRIRLFDWTDYSKQAFRDGENLDEVERKYGYVSRLANQFRIPKQVIVFWRGSDKDDCFDKIRQEIESQAKGTIEIVDIVLSGHKKTDKSLKMLNSIMSKYLGGGFIITNVGRSNGLGPIVSAHTSWPVMSIAATFESDPNDIFSSINMPSDTPHTATPYGKLAFLSALNHLSLNNPVAYMMRQNVIESLDDQY